MAKRGSLFFFLLAISLFGIVFQAKAQTSCYTNPSMEGPAVPHQVPSPWLACYGSPDTQPGNWGFTQPASNGNTYVSFLHSGQSPNGYKEGMTQLLNPCLQGGTTYTITVDLAYSPIYNTAGPGNCPSSFAMYGGNSACAISETLLVSGPITHPNWVTYTFTFTPTQNFCYISFAPYFTGACTGYINIMIDNFTCIQPALVNATSTPESCPGACNGTATANVTQGVPPYTYSWSPGGQTTPTISNLCQGSYTVTVTDNVGQQASSTTTVGGPQPFSTTVTGANVSCFGQNNGTANIVTMGGTSPYTYSWAPSGLNVFNPAGLSAGTHVVTVTDAAGCTTTDSISLTEPPVLIGTIASSTPALCFGSNSGTITGTGSGGTPPYTYTWTPGGNGQTLFNAVANQLYTLNVVDAMGCLAQATHQITQPTQLVGGIINPIQPSCFGNNNGSLTSNVSGGTPPYSYFWNPTGQTTAQATNLSAGNHSLMVIDANGCMVNVSFPLSQPSVLSVGIPSFTNLTCFNSANGTASAMVGGGTPPYSYLWSPSGSTVSNPSNLSAGTHTLTVTDSRGCTATASRTLTQPPAIVPILQQMTPASCFGGTNGSLSVQVSGGVPGYSYSWSPNIGNGLNPTGLSAGSYQLTITDQNNCSQSASYSVTQPNLLQANAQMISGPLCHGDTNAVLQASAQGGVAPYAYLWNNGQTGPNFGSAGLGTYSVVATDANGCTASDTVIVANPALLDIQFATAQMPSCFGFSNGNASFIGSGGTGALSYQWIPNGGNQASANNLPAGNYQCIVTDANGCSDTGSVALTQPTALSIAAPSLQQVTCFGLSNGQASVSVSGATPPYSYLWNTGSTTNSTSNLVAGNYSVVVTDAQGCVDSISAQITQPPVLQTQFAAFDDSLCVGQTFSLSAQVSGGTPSYTYAWSNGGNGSTGSATAVQGQNSLSVTVTDAQGCQSTIGASALAGSIPQAQFTVSPVCLGQPVNIANSPSNAYGALVQTTLSLGNGTTTNGSGNVQYIYPSIGPWTLTQIVRTEFGCADTATQTLTLFDMPQVAFSPMQAEGCSPVCLTFTDQSTVQNASIATYDWQDNGQSFASTAQPYACFSGSGTHQIHLTVTSSDGCTASSAVPALIQVYPNPTAAFGITPQQVSNAVPEVTITNSSQLGTQYMYFLPDGTIQTEPSFSYSNSDTGTHCIQLILSTDYGCVDSATACYRVAPEYSLYIPNAFTPNGDGLNDMFQIKGVGISDFEMSVFDRWGILLFQSTDPLKGWTGHHLETYQPVMQGVYVFKVDVKDIWNKYHSVVGRVHLIR